jgi:hypothetical protein
MNECVHIKESTILQGGVNPWLALHEHFRAWLIRKPGRSEFKARDRRLQLPAEDSTSTGLWNFLVGRIFNSYLCLLYLEKLDDTNK